MTDENYNSVFIRRVCRCVFRRLRTFGVFSFLEYYSIKRDLSFALYARVRL